MKDKSKRLTVVNTEKKPSEKKEVQQVIVQPSSSSSSHAPGFNPNLYLLKSVWDSVFEIKTDVSGQKYIFGKLPVVTKYGITMYADDGSLNLPQLAEGLPYDQRTIWFNPETKQIEVIGGTGGGVADSVLWDNVEGKPSWITSTKPTYSYSEIQGTPDLSGYATTSSLNAVSTRLNDFLEGSDTDTIINKWKELEAFLSGLSESDNLATILAGKVSKSYVDETFVTIAGTEDVTGLHNFVNGLKIGGLPITKKQDDVVYLDANLVVRGGITMYGDGEGGSSVPSYSTLGSLLNVDESNDAAASVDRVLFQSAGSNVWSWKPLSEIGGGSSGGGSVSGDYLPLSGGTLTGYLNVHYNHGVGISSLTAINSSELAWNRADNISLRLRSSNNAMAISVSGTQNNRVGFIQVGHQDYKYASNLGDLYLNKLGGNVYIGENLAIHAGNYSSYALPLSGGTLTGNTPYTLNLDTTTSTGEIWETLYLNGVQKAGLYYNINNNVGLYSYVSNSYMGMKNDGSPYIRIGNNWNTIWHSGNDGSGSGLDADLLDGVEGSKFYREQGRFWSSYATSVLGNGSFYAQGYSPVSGAYSYGSILNFRVEDKVTQFYITDGAQAKGTGGRIFFRDSWNAQESISTRWIEVITSENVDAFALPLSGGNINGKITVSGIGGWAIEQKKGDSYVFSLGSGSSSTSAGTENGILQLYQNGSEVVRLYAASGESSWINSAKLGIGTTKPAYNLDVRGSACCKYISFYNTSGTNEAGWIGRGSESNNHIGLYASTGNNVVMYAGGYLCVTLTNQNALFSGGITMYSDQRKKTILNHVELSLKQIADAPLIEHYYNSDQDKTTHVGSIAQYWAGLNDWFCKLDTEGYYTMEIQNCALASAISIARHLEKYESKTDKTIRKMKKRIQELEDEVERLKQN